MAENMNMNQNQAQKQPGVVSQIKGMLAQDNIKLRFNDVLGKKAPQFMASIVNVVAASPQLMKCQPNSIMAAAFVAASFDLPIDSNLGFAALVPYDKSFIDPKTGQWAKVKLAQFQIMYKGFIQLAIRSGYYKRMNYAVVYQDELKSYNPITGEIEFVDDFSQCTLRAQGVEETVAGYYARFELTVGYVQELFMSKQAVDNHARKYSQSYRSDISKDEKKSKWSTDFEAMALKTVIKQLLSKWGILSIEMQKAITDDQKTFDEFGNESYGDNMPDVIEAEDPFMQIEQQTDTQPEIRQNMEKLPETAQNQYEEEELEEIDITQ